MIGIAPSAFEHLLEPRHVVYFEGGYPEYWQDRVDGEYFRILRTQQITYDRVYILHPLSEQPAGEDYTYPLDFSNHNSTILDLGLYPDNDATLYEILIGMKSTSGLFLAYPRFPMNEWFESLEKGGYIPNVNSETFRYLSPFTEEITPADRPQMRIHTIKDEETVGLLLANDGPMDDKLVINFLINRCLMRKIPKDEVTEKEKDRVRNIVHPGLEARGKWAEAVP